MKISFVTHPGLDREKNEDRFFVKEYGNGTALLAVADGMGGHAGGERAARIAVEGLNDFSSDSPSVEAHLVESLQAANRRMMEISARDGKLRGMGTTLTAAFVKRRIVHWAHVGDSRLYLLRQGFLVQVTEDHTLPGLLLRAGEIDREEARLHPLGHLLMSCLGRSKYEADTGDFAMEENDLLLLSTDGLHDRLSEEHMESLLGSTPAGNLDEKVQALLSAALNAGGRDNITIVAAKP